MYTMSRWMKYTGAGLTIQGPHYPHTIVRRGPFSHTRSQYFLWGCTFLTRKSWQRFF